MTSTPTVAKKEFIKHIEDAIIEHEIIACPNLECNNKLVSKKKMSSEGSSYLEYHCLNPSCSYHPPKQIYVKSETMSESSKVKKLPIEQLMIAVGIFLIGVFCYTGYQLFHVNQYIETELQEHQQSNQSFEDQNLSSTEN